MSRITDKILNDNFTEHDNGYWKVNNETVISCEGHVYTENDNNSLTWYAEVNNVDELKLLLKVLKAPDLI